jgi:hypothetical protein
VKATFDTVREIALGFPHVVEGTMYGLPAFKVRGQFFTCLTSQKLAEPGMLVVRTDLEHRDELIAADPDVYYLKDHYVDYPCVLVRLSRIHPDALRDLLGGARRFVMAQKAEGQNHYRQRRGAGLK